jgi:hypothetical protein
MVLKVVTGKIFKTLELRSASNAEVSSWDCDVGCEPAFVRSGCQRSVIILQILSACLYYRLHSRGSQAESGRIAYAVPNWEFRSPFRRISPRPRLADRHGVNVLQAKAQWLAGCGKSLLSEKGGPQALKRRRIFNGLAARVNSCPSRFC